MHGKFGGGGVGAHQTKKAKEDYIYFSGKITVYVRAEKQFKKCNDERQRQLGFKAKSVNKNSHLRSTRSCT